MVGSGRALSLWRDKHLFTLLSLLLSSLAPFPYLILMWFARFIGFLLALVCMCGCVFEYACQVNHHSGYTWTGAQKINKIKSNYRSSQTHKHAHTHREREISYTLLPLFEYYMSINNFLLSQIFTKHFDIRNDYGANFCSLLVLF